MLNDYSTSRAKRGRGLTHLTQKGDTAMQSMTINTATTKTVVSNSSRALNIALWVLQVLLAAVYVAHGWLLVSPPAELVALMNAQLGVGFRLFLGVAELLAAV